MRKKPKRKVKRPFRKKEITPKIVTHRFYLSESDRLTYSYELDKKREISKVVNVSLEVCIDDKWVTIVRYDSEHGYLHRHMRVSLDNPSDTPTTIGVRKKGNPHNWLTWARKDISKNFINYRTGFFRRSKIKDLY
ncbi:MAG: DUF7718 family protein [Patescibacteria group bacterium]